MLGIQAHHHRFNCARLLRGLTSRPQSTATAFQFSSPKRSRTPWVSQSFQTTSGAAACLSTSRWAKSSHSREPNFRKALRLLLILFWSGTHRPPSSASFPSARKAFSDPSPRTSHAAPSPVAGTPCHSRRKKPLPQTCAGISPGSATRPPRPPLGPPLESRQAQPHESRRKQGRLEEIPRRRESPSARTWRRPLHQRRPPRLRLTSPAPAEQHPPVVPTQIQ